MILLKNIYLYNEVCNIYITIIDLTSLPYTIYFVDYRFSKFQFLFLSSFALPLATLKKKYLKYSILFHYISNSFKSSLKVIC